MPGRADGSGGEAVTPAELRTEILRQYARVGPGGQLSRCSHQRGTHPGGKVIFRTRAAAALAADALAEQTFALRMDVYECRYGRHFHLTKTTGGAR